LRARSVGEAARARLRTRPPLRQHRHEVAEIHGAASVEIFAATGLHRARAPVRQDEDQIGEPDVEVLVEIPRADADTGEVRRHDAEGTGDDPIGAGRLPVHDARERHAIGGANRELGDEDVPTVLGRPRVAVEPAAAVPFDVLEPGCADDHRVDPVAAEEAR